MVSMQGAVGSHTWGSDDPGEHVEPGEWQEEEKSRARRWRLSRVVRTATVGSPGTEQPLVSGVGGEEARSESLHLFGRRWNSRKTARRHGAWGCTDQVKAAKPDGLRTPSWDQKERGSG